MGELGGLEEELDVLNDETFGDLGEFDAREATTCNLVALCLQPPFLLSVSSCYLLTLLAQLQRRISALSKQSSWLQSRRHSRR